MCATVVAIGKRPETFLPGGVEEVEAVGCVVDGEFLDLECLVSLSYSGCEAKARLGKADKP